MSPLWIQIQWTCLNKEEGRRVGRLLLEARLAACVQMIPTIESHFWWEGRIDSAQESKLVIKSRLDLYPQVKELIERVGSYQTPEITYSILDGGNSAYFDWMQSVLVPPPHDTEL